MSSEPPISRRPSQRPNKPAPPIPTSGATTPPATAVPPTHPVLPSPDRSRAPSTTVRLDVQPDTTTTIAVEAQSSDVSSPSVLSGTSSPRQAEPSRTGTLKVRPGPPAPTMPSYEPPIPVSNEAEASPRHLQSMSAPTISITSIHTAKEEQSPRGPPRTAPPKIPLPTPPTPTQPEDTHLEQASEDPPPSPSSETLEAPSSEEHRAGRRLPSRPPALVKTTNTTNLPHVRAQSATSDESTSPRNPKPNIPKKGAALPTESSNGSKGGAQAELTAEDFAWAAKRSASMSSLDEKSNAPETSPDVSSGSSARSVNRVYAMNNGSITAMRKPSTFDAASVTEAIASLSMAKLPVTNPTSATEPSPSHRESQAIVMKLGITPAQEETPEMMRTRGNLADEILKTEAGYLEDLRLIVSKFLVPLRANSKVISPMDSAKLFLNIESLELISEEVLNAMNLAFLQATSSARVSLAPVYLQFTETMLPGFSHYCAGHSESLALLTRLKKKQAGFSAFLESLEADDALSKLKLADFLTRPVQHICRQPLLLRELLKTTPSTHPDYEDLVFALDKINDVVERVNSNAKEMSNIQALTNVESSVNELPEALKMLMPGRYMLKEGRFLRMSQKMGKLPTEQYLFLFNDMLLLTKPKPFSDGEYMYTELLPLQTVMVEDLQDSDEHKNAFSVTSLATLRRHVFVAKDERKNNEIIKRDWLNAITTAKAKFEKGLSGLFDEDSLGVAFKVQHGSTASEYSNPYQAMRDQLASVAAQQRIVTWRGTEILKEIHAINNSEKTASSVPFSMPMIIKFHMDAPCAIKIVSTGVPEVIENEGQVFVFDEFIVFASEKKDTRVKKPYEWLDSVIYSTCVISNSAGPETEKKVLGGRTVYPLTLVSASTQKKFTLYFRSEILKNNIYSTIKLKFAFAQDEAAVNGSASFVSTSQPKEKSSTDDSTSTLKTKKSFFGRKLGYRTTSQSVSTASATSDVPLSPTSSDAAKSTRLHSQSTVPSLLVGSGAPTSVLLNSASSPGPLNTHSTSANGAPNSNSTPPGTLSNWMQTVTDDDDDAEEKLLTADGFEVPPWAPDDSSNVCLGCNSKFTTTNRRHHCRNCGQLFCKKCTQKKCFLPRFGFTQKKMRVCEKCFLKH